MPPKPRIVPLYTVSDSTMLERTSAIQGLFAEDLADFTAFDADFNATFRDAWTADLEAAEALPTDESIQDESAMLTEVVDAAMAAGRDKWNQIKYFLEKAFPDSSASLRAFGSDDYEEAKVVQRDFIGFLENLHAKAEKHKAKLIAAKYTQAHIDEIETLRDALYNANKAQETFKKDRLEATEERRIAMNKVYTTLVQVNKAAQIIYINSAAKRAQYVFDPNGGGGDDNTFTGSLAAGEVKVLATVTYAAGRSVSMENTGNTPITISLNVAAGGPPEGEKVALEPGETLTRTMMELNNNTAAVSLQVKNMDAGAPGAYTVSLS